MKRQCLLSLLSLAGTVLFHAEQGFAGDAAYMARENGVLVFTDTKRNSNYKRYIGEVRLTPATSYRSPRYSSNASNYSFKDFEGSIYQYSEMHGMEPALVRAVIETESNFNPNARSEKGAVGLMQLMPNTAKDLSVNPWSPTQNLDGGIRYLKQLGEQYDQDLRKMLAAYNAGWKNVEKYGGVPPFPETKKYVTLVLQRYYKYRKEMSPSLEYSLTSKSVSLPKSVREEPLSAKLAKSIKKEAPPTKKAETPSNLAELMSSYD